MDILNQKLKPLSKYGDQVPQIKAFADKQKLESGVIVGAAIVVLSLITLIFFGATILTLGITVLYPAAQSIKAIHSEDKNDDKEWLTYWIIFGLFTLIDDFFGWVLALIPYFFWIKLAFFLFLLAPQTKGALTVYNTVAQPFLVKYRKDIEKLIEDIQGVASKAAKDAKSEILKQAQDPTVLLKAAQVAGEAQKNIQTFGEKPVQE